MSPLFLRRKAAVKLPLKLAFISVVFCATLLFSRFSERKHDASVRVESGREGFISRHVLAIPYKERPLIVGENGTIRINETLASNGTEKIHECTPPAYHEFPPDAFTTKQRAQGAIILHTILVVYMFYALAIVCDEYFVSSLDKICERLGLSEDVAGATFMAAGSSAPELFTSIIGVFIAKGDVGVGTIVGSAVFNILFVIGLCGILAGQVVHLNWFPLLRDSLFYSLSVIALILSIFDGNVSWYEALIMLILYAIYIVIMRFNTRIQAYAEARFGKQEEDASIMPGPGKIYGQNYEKFQNEENGQIPNGAVVKADEYFARPSRKLSFEDACFKLMITRLFRPITRFRAAAKIIMIERKRLLRDPAFLKRQKWRTYSVDGSMPSYTKAIRNCLSIAEDPETDDIFQLPSLKSGPLFIARWVVGIPIKSLLYFTVPDCRKDRWARWYMATFGMSIVWIAAFSYVMVWMVALMGYTMGIPDSIMGISFLAAGTSIPDAMASVIVARQGMGDMAVSNTIGSNVFDILMGLAFPWFIKTALVSPGLTVHINSNGMIFSVLLLFLTVLITIGVIHFTGWQLNKRLGMIFLAVYAVFLTFSICIEFNVFGYVNPPMCSEYD
ncbi:sodium/potassium/calcium exchanger 4-like isoform X2 [Lineus longissimus]|uniref:sodium/potassium/calcium exchanger 4-like isoform X2 n=1 Tax=Lineus longissimus TaxID=88925 RepID=UPI002B4C8B9D